MKKLLIAGYETQTAGYRSAFSLLAELAQLNLHGSAELVAAQGQRNTVDAGKEVFAP